MRRKWNDMRNKIPIAKTNNVKFIREIQATYQCPYCDSKVIESFYGYKSKKPIIHCLICDKLIRVDLIKIRKTGRHEII